MERLLRENENRGKTPEQQIREGMHWEPIEEAKARKRQSVPGNQYTEKNGLPENFPEAQSGEARDIIARRVGLGSGKTYEKGRAEPDAVQCAVHLPEMRHGISLSQVLSKV
jgi:ParB family chromosome partitioning protein